ncbi:MAG: endonuclease [Bryobacterales bacterium]|jgi:5-methylcytosine-specific restriction protein A|nr:endonuclease [Bryobacterales bacterium]
MPNSPPRACSVQPCPNAATYRGRCAAHARKNEAQRWEQNAGKYDTPWKKMSKLVLHSEPLCRWCKAEGQVVPATQSDHIIPIDERPDLRLYKPNCMPLCHSHHSKKTNDEQAGRMPDLFVILQRQKVLAAGAEDL